MTRIGKNKQVKLKVTQFWNKKWKLNLEFEMSDLIFHEERLQN